MRWFHYGMVTVLALLLGGVARAESVSPDAGGAGRHLSITLAAETQHPAAGSNVTLALATVPQPGWHGYWENPGDAGFPAKLDWTLPKGVRAGAPAYPVPGRLVVADLMNYVFDKPYAPLVTLNVPAGLPAGTALPVKLHINYLVCSATVCVPETADLAVDLTVGDGAIAPDSQARFDAWRRAVPRSLDGKGTFQIKDGKIRIAIPYPAGAAMPKAAYFYPITTGVVDYAQPQTVARDGDRLVVETKAGGAGGVGSLQGVLQIGEQQGLLVTAAAGIVAPAGNASPLPGDGVLMATLIAFAGAMLGGLILNIMPCVFPILSLKALSLARGHLDEGAARREALAYTAGVVAVCVGLGAAILALRAGGTAVGWAFQLQDPRAIVLLLLLTVALSLNLGGMFEIPTPAFVNRSGGAGGAFATGALAAFIATPCTGPFMGAALGAALVLPWPAALAVFAGLGLGLAVPFLALGFVPALRKRLPKPGVWMETFRRILSIPMWLTAIALAWVLGKEAGVDGLTLGLVAALALAIVLWVAGQRQRAGLGLGLVVGIALLVIAGAGMWSVAGRHPDHVANIAAESGGAEPFSEARLQSLRKSGRPVFVYFTADWCLTCKVNERAAIETDATRAAFAAHNVAVLIGDWTNGDPVMGRFIEAHNRAGVPLYLYYVPGMAEPNVLPQVLTPGLLAEFAGK
ncbi:protein-disulfide reductase DsbD family protein [Sphingomonas sp.]|uniref:protein-disulfide reductase DsbD family protein n=1 Tax=Sphingomonas sp. TaxID=28214 RepID=UPI003569B445